MLGGVLVVLGIGTWALIPDAAMVLLAPAVFGTALLVIGSLLLRQHNWYCRLVGLSVLIALIIIAQGVPAFGDALRDGGSGLSPVVTQQLTGVFLCGLFVLVSLRMLCCQRLGGTPTHS